MPGSLRYAAGDTSEVIDILHTATLQAQLTVQGNGSLRHAPIADPGNAGAIPVTRDGFCPIVTAGAETRTVADPTYVGQRLTLYFDTDGGNCVLTFATDVETTDGGAHNTLTWDTVGDGVDLVAVTRAGSLEWAVVADLGGAVVNNWTSV